MSYNRQYTILCVYPAQIPKAKNGRDGEPKRYAFWFSEFGALPQTPLEGVPQEFARSANSQGQMALPFGPRKG
jgi:hypothetical protein